MKTHILQYDVPCDFVVIGSGVAGLIAAHVLKEHGRVTILTNRNKTECNTQYAQGGIAAVMGPDDSFQKHIRDTMEAGAGLCDDHVVEYVVKEGPGVIHELLDMGAHFDTLDGSLYLSREGAHSAKRVIHSFGDSTGKEIEATLLASVNKHANVQFMENCPAVKLVVEDGCVKGVVFYSLADKRFYAITASPVILATGGIGGLFAESTNPESVTGSGFGLAFQAGAILRDMEFIQFHPTVFINQDGPQRFLITEAMRGEGAVLRNHKGERFMGKYHQDKELAPRDVVARAILNEMEDEDKAFMLLDVRHLEAAFLQKRFPGIYTRLLEYGIDITRAPIPVRPATHYIMGGVMTDIFGRTSIPGLLACGEVASTGIHGANRLASNSLLEGLVFGRRTAVTAVTEKQLVPPLSNRELFLAVMDSAELDAFRAVVPQIKQQLWRNAGVVRNETRLTAGLAFVKQQEARLADQVIPAFQLVELHNMLVTARIIFLSALYRKESIGGHFREDYPNKSMFMQKHTYMQN